MNAFIRIVFSITTLVAISAHAQPLTKITIVETGSGSATRWPIYGAQLRGYFKEVGLEVEFIPAPASNAVMQQLAAGSAPMGAASPIDALRAIDKGAPISLLRIESTQAPYEVFAKKTITKLADLKGKIIMIGGARDITRFYMERMLFPNGMKAGEFDYVYAGATAQRYAALQSGSIDATILAAPFNFRARSDGFTNLGAPATYVRDVPFSAVLVNNNWARQNRATVDKFLAAYEKGAAWYHDPANRTEAIDILQKESKQDRRDVEQTYDFYREIKVLDRDGIIENKGLADLVNLLKEGGELEGSTDLTRFYNTALGAKAR